MRRLPGETINQFAGRVNREYAALYATLAKPPEFQYHWRCAHHPSSIENFFDFRTTCEWDCHTQELRWYHNGEHPLPTSWGTPPIGT